MGKNKKKGGTKGKVISLSDFNGDAKPSYSDEVALPTSAMGLAECVLCLPAAALLLASVPRCSALLLL